VNKDLATDLEKLRQVTAAIAPLPDADWTAFAALFSRYEAKRKELITRTGEPEKFLYFVVDGVQRIYFDDGEHREATLLFTYAPSFGGILDSLLMQQPAKYNYEPLTPSVFLTASQSALFELIRKSPAINLLIQKGVTASMSGILDRLVELQSFSAEERFTRLLKRSPHLLQLIPHKYLANYIGVDATNFSKLMNSVRV
jgi:CRP-like cAMP-binding protein